MKPIHVVSATRMTQQAFWSEGALGLSLRRLADPRLLPWIAYENRTGLPEIYNQLLAPGGPQGSVVFVHDDLWLDDPLFGDRIEAGLARFDVIGLAGNRRRVPRQPSWAFVDDSFRWDAPSNLSGSVGHGPASFGRQTRYGATPAACELLDGVLLAADAQTLRERGCRFDPRFRFHFYDLDFCRTARALDLSLGTWAIGVTHQSGGAFGTPAWREGWRDYVAKWGA